MPDLLIELFSEEIPARMQARAADDLRRLMTEGLVEAGLTYSGAKGFATPRRLTLAIEGLTAASPTRTEERRGPKVGAPDKAIEGFLRSTGLSRDALTVKDDKKGQVYMARITTPGRPAAEIVAEVLTGTIRNFPWPKSMRWGAGNLRWVRPLHRILCLLTDEAGATPVALDIDGIPSGAQTQGHRFMAPALFAVTGFDDYAAGLKRAHVILDPEERRETIWHDITNQAFALGLEAVEDHGLLAEVAGLVEWPVVLIGAIGEDFLHLPPEVLRTSMKEHQKFFSLRNPQTGRIEAFATVANTETADQGATILAGNRKVLAARLSDARFFWDNDLRTVRAGGLTEMAAPLADVTFERRLGSQAARIARIAALARTLAPMVGAEADDAETAARVAKADLASEMVYEFPELQGIMGRYYAQEQGLSPEIAAACALHYKPLGPSDDVPEQPVSVAVALADKLDLLAGFWAIDEKPTGSKDPFALRRAALGVIRLILSRDYRLNLNEITEKHYEITVVSCADANQLYIRRDDRFHPWHPSLHPSETIPPELYLGPRYKRSGRTTIVELPDDFDWVASTTNVADAMQIRDDLLTFFHERLKVHLRDEGIPHDVIEACLAMPKNDDLTFLVRRAKALSEVLSTEDGNNLVQGFKRANNILTQAEAADGVAYEYGPDRKFAESGAETALFDALDTAEPQIAAAIAAEDFPTAMTAMATLRTPIDAFFEAVQVNSDNQIVRRNRLNLLHRIRTACLQAADLTKLQG